MFFSVTVNNEEICSGCLLLYTLEQMRRLIYGRTKRLRREESACTVVIFGCRRRTLGCRCMSAGDVDQTTISKCVHSVVSGAVTNIPINYLPCGSLFYFVFQKIQIGLEDLLELQILEKSIFFFSKFKFGANKSPADVFLMRFYRIKFDSF